MTQSKPAITLFHCINAFEETSSLTADQEGDIRLTIIKMACSSMTKDIVLLKAFEAGADAVVVLVCPEEACRYGQGSIRAAKRVAWVKGLLDEIGLDGRRLAIHTALRGDVEAAVAGVTEAVKTVASIGPNPAVRMGPL